MCGPALTTIGKRKGKVKWASAEAKRRAEQLDKEWNNIKMKHGADLEDKKRRRAMAAEPWISKPDLSLSAPKIPSLDTGWIPCVKKATPVYTGTKVKGIATMHKSNAVPIFSDEEAIDISRMRR